MGICILPPGSRRGRHHGADYRRRRIIGEETGFIGVLFLLFLYTLFIWRGAKIALNCGNEFGLLVASGTILMVAIQVVLNLLVVTSSMPATGVNLPFVSYGGNALMIFMFMSGVMMNISRHMPDKPPEEYVKA